MRFFGSSWRFSGYRMNIFASPMSLHCWDMCILTVYVCLACFSTSRVGGPRLSWLGHWTGRGCRSRSQWNPPKADTSIYRALPQSWHPPPLTTLTRWERRRPERERERERGGRNRVRNFVGPETVITCTESCRTQIAERALTRAGRVTHLLSDQAVKRQNLSLQESVVIWGDFTAGVWPAKQVGRQETALEELLQSCVRRIAFIFFRKNFLKGTQKK
jgi:hypothetical protein